MLRNSSKTKSECIKLIKQKEFILITKAFFATGTTIGFH